MKSPSDWRADNRYRILGDLSDREKSGTEVGEVPLKVTEERLRAEQERNAALQDPDRASLPIRRSAAPSRLLDEPFVAEEWALVPVESAVAQGPPAGRPASPSRPAPPASAPPMERDRALRARRSSRALGSAVIILAAALGGTCAYGYLALRQHSVILSKLPGADSVRVMRADYQAFERSRFASDVASFGEKAGPELRAAASRAEEVFGEIHSRYEQWRARH